MDLTSGGMETSLNEYTPQALTNKKMTSRQIFCRLYRIKKLPLFTDIIFFQFSVQCSFTDAKIRRCILSFSFMFLKSLYDQFLFLIHYTKRFFHFLMMLDFIAISVMNHHRLRLEGSRNRIAGKMFLW